MPQTADFFCHLCAEYIAERDDPTFLTISVARPGDRLGTPFDAANVPAFAAILHAMNLPTLDACAECLFVGTIDPATGVRTGPPVFAVQMPAALRQLVIQQGAHPDYPGQRFADVEQVKALGKDSTIALEPRWRALHDLVFGPPDAAALQRYHETHGIFPADAAPVPVPGAVVRAPSVPPAP